MVLTSPAPKLLVSSLMMFLIVMRWQGMYPTTLMPRWLHYLIMCCGGSLLLRSRKRGMLSLSSSPLTQPNCSVEYRCIDGYQTEFVWFGEGVASGSRLARSCADRTLVVVIPGWPGTALLYAKLAQVLANHDAVQQHHCTVVIVSWTGHSHDPRYVPIAARPQLTIEEHAEHYAKVMEHLLRGDEWGRVVLCGHSLGAWMVSRVLTLRRHTITPKISQVNLLCPCLESMALTTNGRIIGPILKGARKMGLPCVLNSLLLWLPKSCVGRAIAFAQYLRGKTDSVMENESSWFWWTLANQMSYQVISKGVCVGVQGLTVIDSFSDQPDVVDTLNSLPDLRFLYAGWDGWNPPEWRERWAALFPRSQHHVYPGVRHGVVTAETGAVFIGEGLAKHVASLGLACQR